METMSEEPGKYYIGPQEQWTAAKVAHYFSGQTLDTVGCLILAHDINAAIKDAIHKAELNEIRWWDHTLATERKKLKQLEGDYQKIVTEVLKCNPIPANRRDDNQLEPPWEVIARLRRALESIAANSCCDKCQEAALVAKAALSKAKEGK
jgi:hypothetical protein